MHTAISHALHCLAERHLRPEVLIVADLHEPATSDRLTVLDLRGTHPRVLLRADVAEGSGGIGDLPGSHASAPGLYSIGMPYQGAHGRSWTLQGLSRSDWRAASRDIVLHDATYVSAGWAGRSWGCPAVSVATLAALRPWLPPKGTAALWIDARGAACGPRR